MKIKNRIIVTFFSLGVFLTVASIFVFYNIYSQHAEEDALEDLTRFNTIKESQIYHLLDENYIQVSTFSNLDILHSFTESIDGDVLLKEAFSDIVNINSYNIFEIAIYDKNGQVLASNYDNKIDSFEEFSRPLEYIHKKTNVNKIKYFEEKKSYSYLITSPIKDRVSGDIKFILGVRYSYAQIDEIIVDNTGYESSGETISAISVDDRIIFLNNDIALDKNYNKNIDIPMKHALGQQIYSFTDINDSKGIEVMAVTLFIDGLDMGVVTKINRKDTLARANNLWFIVIIMGSIVILLDYLFVLWQGRRIASQIELLEDGVIALSEGSSMNDLDFPADYEIKKTQEAVNKLVAQISEEKLAADEKISLQTKNLRDQQMAILNILEDVEGEKEKVIDGSRELEKFKLAVDNTSDHVVITDSSGVILYANRAVETITGFKVSDVIGKKVGTKENWGGLMGEAFYKNLWETLKTEKKSFSGYINNIRKNGEKYEALANISPVFDAGGKVRFFVGIERDFTREREVDRAKSEFVSLASHQLRTPLSTVNWYTEILLAEDAGKINKDQKEYLTEIYKGNQRMVNLVNALLNVSRIDLGTLSIDPEPTDLLELAESVLKELELKIKERKHKIVKNFDKDIPKINLDSKMMRIVWQNYLTNAVKYTPENGIIEVSIKKKKTLVEISVKDDGMGIPEAQQEEIFEKLFRADNAREKETDGTGLGLYIVKSIVEEFGGKVWFNSKESKGSTFFATIPLSGVKAKSGTKGLEYVD